MADKFTGKEGEMISLPEARLMVNTYKMSAKFKANHEIKGIFYGREHLLALLEQKDCMGIRIYYGIEPEGSKHIPNMVLVGANENMDDMINGKILERGSPCPNWCPSGESLDG